MRIGQRETQVPNTGTRGTRHSLDVALVEANANLAVIKQALGHKSIASTSFYTVPTDETAGKAVVAALASL
jgi:site-specific recombinase XerD